MITKLLPENVTENWETIKFAIREALPPFAQDTPDKITRILESIILGELEVWVYYDLDEGVIRLKSVITTSIVTDSESKTKNLLIYSIYNFTKGSREEWLEGMEALKKYAKANDCLYITGFTVEPLILSFVNSIGGDTSVRFIRIPV